MGRQLALSIKVSLPQGFLTVPLPYPNLKCRVIGLVTFDRHTVPVPSSAGNPSFTFVSLMQEWEE